LGLALGRAAYRARLVGIDTAETLIKAKQIGAVDDTCTSWQEGIAGADFVFLNIPMLEAERLIPQIARELPEDAVLSDATPLKLKIGNILRANEKRRFACIGLHVLRQSSEEGLEGASLRYCLKARPTPRQPSSGLKARAFSQGS
jgi:prephenate dehydrogenase